MYKIAVIGDRESICGFAALGLSVFPIENSENPEKLLDTLAASEYGVIFITEETAAKISEAVDKYRSSALPAIIQIPGVKGNTGDGMKKLHESVEKAVGSDILLNQK